MAIKIDGKALAEKLEQQTRTRLERLLTQHQKPVIVSFYNPLHEPSAIYTAKKLEAAERVGIDFHATEYQQDSLESDLGEVINDYNNDPNITGIMLQLPAPGNLGAVAEKITAKKDVDGLTKAGRHFFSPATVCGVEAILDHLQDEHDLKWLDKKITVIGANGLIGNALLGMLSKRGAIYTGVDLDTPSETYVEALNNADILISATGLEDQIDPAQVKPGFIFINVGLGKPPQELIDKTSYYTPQFGGSGPMTVWALMANCVDAFENNRTNESRVQ